jgi:tetratricopeptide (TPR) repeat protein
MNKKVKVLITLIIIILIALTLYLYSLFLALAFIIALIGYYAYRGRSSMYVFLGNSRYSKGQLGDAIRLYKKAFDAGKVPPQIAVSYSYLLLKSGNIEDSEKILSDLLGSKLAPDDEMFAKSNMSLVLWKKGELQASIALLEEVFINYKTSTVYGTLGYLLILNGDLDKALSLNLEAHEYNDKNKIIQDNLGQTYFLMGEYEKSAEIYETLVSANPTFPEAYYNYGLLLEATANYDEALTNFRRALNYKLSFLSTVTKEEIQGKVKELTQRCKQEE